MVRPSPLVQLAGWILETVPHSASLLFSASAASHFYQPLMGYHRHHEFTISHKLLVSSHFPGRNAANYQEDGCENETRHSADNL